MLSKDISPFQQSILQGRKFSPALQTFFGFHKKPKISFLSDNTARKRNILDIRNFPLQPYLPNCYGMSESSKRSLIKKLEEDFLLSQHEALLIVKHIELCIEAAFEEWREDSTFYPRKKIKSFWSGTRSLEMCVLSSTQNQNLLLRQLHKKLLLYFHERAYVITSGGLILLQKSKPETCYGLGITPEMFKANQLYDLNIKGPGDDTNMISIIQITFGQVKITIRICSEEKFGCVEDVVHYSKENPDYTVLLFELRRLPVWYLNEEEQDGFEFILIVKELFEIIKLGWQDGLKSSQPQETLSSRITRTILN